MKLLPNPLPEKIRLLLRKIGNQNGKYKKREKVLKVFQLLFIFIFFLLSKIYMFINYKIICKIKIK